jgi:hypothetical protein
MAILLLETCHEAEICILLCNEHAECIMLNYNGYAKKMRCQKIASPTKIDQMAFWALSSLMIKVVEVAG